MGYLTLLFLKPEYRIIGISDYSLYSDVIPPKLFMSIIKLSLIEEITVDFKTNEIELRLKDGRFYKHLCDNSILNVVVSKFAWTCIWNNIKLTVINSDGYKYQRK